MKNIFIWTGVALIVAATVIAQFTGVPVATWIELAGFAIGLAVSVLGIVTKAEKKDWRLYAAIVGIITGSALLVFGGLSEGTITTLISLIAGVVAMVIGILPTVLAEKKNKG